MGKISLSRRLKARLANWSNQRRIARLAGEVARHAHLTSPAVVMFNASARIGGLSLNAAFALLASCGLRLGGVRVIQFVCQQGMSRCVQGTNREDYTASPPCEACLSMSQRLYAGAEVHWAGYKRNPELAAALEGLSLDELSCFEYLPSDSQFFSQPIPLGKLVLPAIRWALRRHTFPENNAIGGPQDVRLLLREYTLSAYSIAHEFASLLARERPQAAVIFNGIMFPEAAARWVAQQLGVPSFTHEVGFQRFSTFFTAGEATAYPMHIPESFTLSAEQDQRLDSYLEQRFQGKFTMAGIRFWPEMRGLDLAFLEKAASFRQVVPVFTNVIYDTSQVHANTIFPQMFAWLDQILEVIRQHPETLFVIRAHPDEMRPGSKKLSRESVHDWVERNSARQLPNVVFIDSQEYISSYELIQRSKFVLVYNSSIGLEATLLGAPVLCGGKARYTQYPIVFLPESAEAYRQQTEAFLSAEKLELPEEFSRNARRFLYYQLYRASLPLDEFIEAATRQGFVQLRRFSWQQLRPENNLTMSIIKEGILHGKPFLLPDEI